jgi:hypothetical protein
MKYLLFFGKRQDRFQIGIQDPMHRLGGIEGFMRGQNNVREPLKIKTFEFTSFDLKSALFLNLSRPFYGKQGGDKQIFCQFFPGLNGSGSKVQHI